MTTQSSNGQDWSGGTVSRASPHSAPGPLTARSKIALYLGLALTLSQESLGRPEHKTTTTTAAATAAAVAAAATTTITTTITTTTISTARNIMLL